MGANGEVSQSVKSVLPIAIDAMGGDLGLEVQVEGAVRAFKEFGSDSILVGPSLELRSVIESLGASSLPIAIEDAPDTISMEDSPSKAVLRKPQASLCVAYQLVESGRASAMMSSGNSGAMMAAGTIISGLMPGIKRPAIATLLPGLGENPPNVVIDSGANVDCHAHNLVQFAVMGAIYYSCLFNVDHPKVALLSNGTEASKGTDILRAAAIEIARLQRINYVGYIEGRDIPTDKAQVIVCDGFVGNVALKAMEGCVRLIADQLTHESQRTLGGKLGQFLLRGVFHEVFRQRFDYTAHGGAPLLGLRRLAVVLHGSSDARAVMNAIRVSAAFARARMCERIGTELAQLEDESIAPLENIFSNVMSRKGEGKSEPAAGEERAKVRGKERDS